MRFRARALCAASDPFADVEAAYQNGMSRERVIAAAPALLVALEALLPHAPLAPEWAIRAAKDAIAQANGETP